MKKCIKCSVSKDRSLFYKSSKSRDGLNPYCKACNLEAVKLNVGKNKSKNNSSNVKIIKDKKCHSCKQIKGSELFNVDKTKHDGLSGSCKACVLIKNQEYRSANPEYSGLYNKRYYQDNKDSIIANVKSYNNKNKKLIHSRSIEYQKRPLVRVRRRLTKRIREALFSVGKRKNHETLALLGCTFDFFKQHIESLFQDGMSWCNYGKGGWELDHIRPCSSFDLTNEDEVKKCFNYTNIQPLWKIDNVIKGSNYQNKRHRYDC